MSNKHDNIYNILGKLDALTPKQAPAESAPAKIVRESVEARGSVLEGVTKVEARLAEMFDQQGMEEATTNAAGQRRLRAAMQAVQEDGPEMLAYFAIAALYGNNMWDNDAMGDLVYDLEQTNPSEDELKYIIVNKTLPARLKSTRFTNTDDVQFGHMKEESDWSNLGAEYKSTKPGTKEPTHTGEKEYFKGGVKHTRDFDRSETGERGRPKKDIFKNKKVNKESAEEGQLDEVSLDLARRARDQAGARGQGYTASGFDAWKKASNGSFNSSAREAGRPHWDKAQPHLDQRDRLQTGIEKRLAAQSFDPQIEEEQVDEISDQLAYKVNQARAGQHFAAQDKAAAAKQAYDRDGGMKYAQSANDTAQTARDARSKLSQNTALQKSRGQRLGKQVYEPATNQYSSALQSMGTADGGLTRMKAPAQQMNHNYEESIEGSQQHMDAKHFKNSRNFYKMVTPEVEWERKGLLNKGFVGGRQVAEFLYDMIDGESGWAWAEDVALKHEQQGVAESRLKESVNFAEMMKEQHQTIDEYLMELQSDIAEFKKSGHMSDKLRDSLEMHKFSKKQITDEVKGPSFAPQFPATPAPAKPPGMMQRAGSAIAGGVKAAAGAVNRAVGHGSDADMLNDLKRKTMDEELNELARLAGLSESLKGGQKKLDKNKNGKLDADDFKRLRDKVSEATVDEDYLKDKKADKDYDGDGEVETGSEEHAGSVDKAIKKAQAEKDSVKEAKKPDANKNGIPDYAEDGKGKNDLKKKKVDECGPEMSPFSSMGHEEETGMSINSSMDTKTGRKTLSVTADGEAAEQLAQMLKMAGLGGGHEHSHEEPEAVVIQAEPEEQVEEEREGQYANTPDEEVENIDSIMHQGNDLNREKEQYADKPKAGDNPMATRESIEMPRSLSKMLEGIKMVEDEKCNHTAKGEECPVHGMKECSGMYEAKPSAGMSKGEKSSLVKKAKKGGDIGKPGKSFDKVAKAAGGGEKGKRIAAAAMWKNAAK